jgi:hypothetical protein
MDHLFCLPADQQTGKPANQQPGRPGNLYRAPIVGTSQSPLQFINENALGAFAYG